VVAGYVVFTAGGTLDGWLLGRMDWLETKKDSL